MMRSTSPGWAVRLALRAYQSLLGLYPAGFRAEYGQEMQAAFTARCLEAYQTAGSAGIGRWLLKILIWEAASLYKEYLEMTEELFENHRDARKILGLGMLFLTGSWIALLFVIPSSRAEGRILPGVALVLINALLVARSLIRSGRIEYVAGMSALANTFLLAGLMAVQASLDSLHPVAVLLQVVLIGLHAVLLWRLRGEDLTDHLRERGE